LQQLARNAVIVVVAIFVSQCVVADQNNKNVAVNLKNAANAANVANAASIGAINS
jgi:hypothetical protein